MATQVISYQYRACVAGAIAAAALFIASCGGDSVTQSDRFLEPTAIPAPSGLDANGDPVTLEVVDGGPATGLTITDYQGFAVYGIAGETAAAMLCLDDCVKSWVPVSPRAGTVSERLQLSLYSAINRPDGIAQATYNDIPLYTWTGDTEIGITSGAGVAGVWYALTQTGGFIGDTP